MGSLWVRWDFALESRQREGDEMPGFAGLGRGRRGELPLEPADGEVVDELGIPLWFDGGQGT
jgi:hypothetical protein